MSAMLLDVSKYMTNSQDVGFSLVMGCLLSVFDTTQTDKKNIGSKNVVIIVVLHHRGQ